LRLCPTAFLLDKRNHFASWDIMSLLKDQATR
jgi:hypothetical protein